MFLILFKYSFYVLFVIEVILHCNSLQGIEFVLLLLNRGVDIDLIDTKSGKTCLHYVALTGFLELAVVLAAKDAQFNKIDYCLQTPAKVALNHGNVIVADFLRKGYRPPKLFSTLPLQMLWTKKIRARITENRARRLIDNL